MRFRRRRRRSKSWVWADRFTFAVTDTGTPQIGFHEILPAGRVKFMCDTAGRTHITTSSILLWLDFAWHVTSSSTIALPDVDFFVIKLKEDEVGNTEDIFDPYVQPQVPANITSWDTSPSDGLDPFLWTHHMKGSGPPNSVVVQPAGGTLYNQLNEIKSDGTNAVRICRKFQVTQEWQPDVVIKSKRRMAASELLAIAMRTTGTNTNVIAQLDVNVRLLA